MSQKNRRLNVHVIKTKRIECGKLNLPVMLAHNPRRETGTRNETTLTRSKVPSFQTSSHDDPGCEYSQHRESDSRRSIIDDSQFSPTEDVEEDVVFEEASETPSEAFAKPRKCCAISLPLPACLGAESEGARVDDDVERSACLRPKRLFEEALNLECSHERARLRPSGEGNQGAWHEFSRERAMREWRAEMDNAVHSARTPQAVRVSGKLIADFNNNNCSSLAQKRVFHDTARRRRSYSDGLDLRRDWEQKILGLTATGTEFGTERGGLDHERPRSRPRSVTLTGGVYGFVKAQEKARSRNSERRARSESKQGMPKLQTVVWDYIKRRSSKRKGKRDGETKGNSKSTEHEKNAIRNSESEAESTSCISPAQQLKTDHANIDTKSGNAASQNSSFNADKVSPTLGARWKSTPNLRYSEATEYAKRILQRQNSWDELNSRKDRPTMTAKELSDDPEILMLFLKTNSELRPMEERLKTLALSREWLLKELKELRQDDRRLARQFINLRSAIMEVRRAREKEDSDCDSDGEVKKSKWSESKRLAAEQDRHINDHDYHMHVTPTRNILSYC